MSFLLDTSVLIEIENNNQEIINKIGGMKPLLRQGLFISFFTFCEFYYGIINKSPKNIGIIMEQLRAYKQIQTTEETAVIFSKIRHTLEKKGELIPLFDLFIAAMAMENNLTLLSLDQHFERIEGLNVVIL